MMLLPELMNSSTDLQIECIHARDGLHRSSLYSQLRTVKIINRVYQINAICLWLLHESPGSCSVSEGPADTLLILDSSARRAR